MNTDRCNNKKTKNLTNSRGTGFNLKGIRAYYVTRLYLRISEFICGLTAFYGVIKQQNN